MVQDTVIPFISFIFQCTVNGPVLLTDVLNTFLETLQTVMFVFRMWADTNCESVCVMFLNNQEAIMCDKNGLKPDATKIPTIILQTVEEVFPALKENLVSVLYRTLILINALCVIELEINRGFR